MKTPEEIQELSQRVSNANNLLEGIRKEIKSEVGKIEERFSKGFDLAAEKLADAEEALSKAIEESPGLYDEPRTQTYHNVKAGLQKEHDSYDIIDQDKTVKLIKELMPEHSGTLIKVTESVIIEPLKNFGEDVLKEVGINFVEGKDKVTISIVKPKVAKEIKKAFGKSPMKDVV